MTNKNHSIYLPYTITTRHEHKSSDYSVNPPKRIYSKKEELNQFWLKNILVSFTNTFSNRIIVPEGLSKYFKQDIVIPEYLQKNIIFKKFRNMEKRADDIDYFEDSIKHIDMTYNTPTGFKSSLFRDSSNLYTSFNIANSFKSDFISRIDLDFYLKKVREVRLKNTTHVSSIELLEGFSDILSSYHPLKIEGIGIKPEVFESSSTMWELQDIILNDKCYKKVCGIANNFRQMGTKVHLNCRKLSEKVLDIISNNSNILHAIQGTVLLPLSHLDKAVIGISGLSCIRLSKYLISSEQLPIIYKDPYDHSITQGIMLKKSDYGRIQSVAGRCKKCGNLNTELHDLFAKKNTEQLHGDFLICKNCGYNEVELEKNRLGKDVIVIKDEIVSKNQKRIKSTTSSPPNTSN